MTEDLKTIKEVAQEHAKFISDFINFLYKEAFEHGYKHGREDATN